MNKEDRLKNIEMLLSIIEMEDCNIIDCDICPINDGCLERIVENDIILAKKKLKRYKKEEVFEAKLLSLGK